MLYDPETGVPKAAIDGNYITVIRTGAVGAIAARLLARRDSRKAAMIGAGVQGGVQLAGLREVLPIDEVRCYDRDSAAAETLTREAAASGLRATAATTAAEAIGGADIVVTATPSFQPIVEQEWIGPGMHVNAFGADTRGKQEIDEKLMARAKVVVDYLPQSREIGECQHAFRTGLIEGVHAELGEILAGRKPGRESDSEITLFDATGIALQDLAVAARAYDAAMARGIGTQVVLD
jgi:ornithine cyclodeaminase/alanine dehydrogenase-like protein (mu-crystallin family)